MRKMFFLAAAAAMFAACTSNDNLETQAPEPTAPADIAVGFDAYTQRSVTRAGVTGDINLDALKNNSFGVFGYYTDANEYDPQATPNFMYNEKIMWDETNDYWYYSPVKYWPNEYGGSAISDEQDKVSFFAYAPYVSKESALTGNGITKINNELYVYAPWTGQMLRLRCELIYVGARSGAAVYPLHEGTVQSLALHLRRQAQ